ncbi:hypothetical protein JCM31826_01940 [Thermaurantimonas aggregans]|uniref:SPOR domain-containing protein n=1 Tax=Thermaurantimonas aggregans TaxID=2173829 RepID=A0A401XI77_9FLAO|nr:SPOR domain-containing protein [Thermaurantimonas aggregans]MCX8149315.1 SPOR domain-containing protein [Thermaurantimonas aggregans]GCD76712.1 hypothetical protein JCM31826_01940 [Thermaurantimonas aggregans]
MKNMLRFVTLLLSTFSYVQNVSAQGHFVVNTSLGVMKLISPLDSWSYSRYKINASLIPEVGYQFNDKFYAGAMLYVGILNGANANRYFESTYFAPSLVGRFNFLPYISNSSKMRLEVEGGLEVLSYYTTLYNRITNAKILQVPSNRGSLSFAPGGFGGLRVTIPLNNYLGLSGGYRFHLVNNPWIDGVKSNPDEFLSFLHDFNVGFRLSLENMLKKNEVRVDRKKYQNLNAQLNDLQQNQQRLTASNEAKLKEKDNRILALTKENDSLRAYIASLNIEEEDDSKSGQIVTTSGGKVRGDKKQIDPMEAVKNKAFRIIVGSFPTQLMAQTYMEKSPLNNPDMFVVYVEDLKTYRVVYKSYPTRDAAMKDLGKVRESVKSAWIIYF